MTVSAHLEIWCPSKTTIVKTSRLEKLLDEQNHGAVFTEMEGYSWTDFVERYGAKALGPMIPVLKTSV